MGGGWRGGGGLCDGTSEKKIDKPRDNNAVDVLNQTESSPRVKPSRTKRKKGKKSR